MPGWNRPITPWRFSPVRSSRILVLPFLSIGSLSEGTSGMPRQVMNGEPNKVTVGGGTPRRVHSRPKAAMARGWARKNAGSFQTLVSSSSRSSGVGRRLRVRDDLRRRRIGDQAVIAVVDDFVFLLLLHLLDQQAQLFLNLIVGMAVEIGDAGLDVENRGDGVQRIFARLRLRNRRRFRGRSASRSRAGLHSTSASVSAVPSLTRFRR